MRLFYLMVIFLDFPLYRYVGLGRAREDTKDPAAGQLFCANVLWLGP